MKSECISRSMAGTKPKCSALLVALLVVISGCEAKEKSVRPGVNKEFEGKVDVQQWVERFEGESREIYHHREEIVDLMHLKPRACVADIGAGTGFFSMLFARRIGPHGRVYAVDISDEFVHHIREEARHRGLRNVKTILCKPDSTELPENSIDVAFICDTYHHFEYPKSTMKSLWKAMRPEGELFVVDFDRVEGKSRDWVLSHVRAGREVFQHEIEAAGFKSEPLQGNAAFLSENYMLRFKRVEKR